MRNFVLAGLLLLLPLAAQARNLKPVRDQIPHLSDDRVILHTNLGDIMLGFYPNIAPNHVEQILKMVKAGVYDGTTFYRVERLRRPSEQP